MNIRCSLSGRGCSLGLAGLRRVMNYIVEGEVICGWFPAPGVIICFLSKSSHLDACVIEKRHEIIQPGQQASILLLWLFRSSVLDHGTKEEVGIYICKPVTATKPVAQSLLDESFGGLGVSKRPRIMSWIGSIG